MPFVVAYSLLLEPVLTGDSFSAHRRNRIGFLDALIRHRQWMGYETLRKGRWSGRNQIYHVFFVTRNRNPHMHDFRCARMVVDALRKQDEARYVESLCFCVMPDHCHWLLALTSEKTLSVVINNAKSLSARGINRLVSRSGPIWHRGFYDRAIRREEDLEGVARYIVANPVRAGLVSSVRKYPHWDAVWVR